MSSIGRRIFRRPASSSIVRRCNLRFAYIYIYLYLYYILPALVRHRNGTGRMAVWRQAASALGWATVLIVAPSRFRRAGRWREGRRWVSSSSCAPYLATCTRHPCERRAAAAAAPPPSFSRAMGREARGTSFLAPIAPASPIAHSPTFAFENGQFQ